MGFLGELFDAEARRKKKIERLGKKVQQKYGQTDDRMGAAIELKRIGDEEARRALIKRFSVACDNKLHDQDEKALVCDMLVEMGPEVIPQIREYLARETEVTWAVRTLKRLQSPEEWAETVLSVIAGKTSEEEDPEKICQILTVLHDETDPRIAPVVAKCLTDLDDTVRFAAIETLATLPDVEEVRGPMLEALVRPEEDSNRITHRIVEVFRDRGWEVKGHRKAVEERLPEGFYLDRQGHIKQLQTGVDPDAPEA